MATINSWWSGLLIKVPFTSLNSAICQGLTDIFTCPHWNLAWRASERKNGRDSADAKFTVTQIWMKLIKSWHEKLKVQCFEMYCFPNNTFKKNPNAISLTRPSYQILRYWRFFWIWLLVWEQAMSRFSRETEPVGW